MAYNPFLSIGEPAAPVTTESFNPFMMTDIEQSTVSGDNPFAASNPFSDFGGELEPAAGDTAPMDIFGGAQLPEIGAKHFDVFSKETIGSHDLLMSQPMETDRLTKPTELELFSTSPDCFHLDEEVTGMTQSSANLLPPETQNLILSVTGQMEFTSSHLLDRIPPTRTPSPVSIRDMHSPSPTPEPEYLDERFVSAETSGANQNKPARPPPARPPPVSRPPPPRPVAPPHVKPSRPQTPPNSSLEDINLFDAPVPVAVKPTKEHILSLYSTPKKEEEKQIDFLSDDILDCLPNTEFETQTQFTKTVTKTLSLVEPDPNQLDDNKKTPQSDTMPFVCDSNSESIVTAMDCSEPSGDIAVFSSKTSPFENVVDDHFQMKHVNEVDNNPFQNVGMDDMNFDSTGVDITGSLFISSTNDVNKEHKNDNFSIPITEPVEYLQGNTFNNTTDSVNNDQINAFDSSSQNDFANTSPAVEYNESDKDNTLDSAAQQFPVTEDAFDAFTAKFNSTAANQMNTDVWGSESAAEGAPTSFEAEAFDPFLSLAAPPPVCSNPRRDSGDSDNDSFSVFIKPKEIETNGEESSVPALAPPPRGHAAAASADASRVNTIEAGVFQTPPPLTLPYTEGGECGDREGGAETPPTPLFDEDTSAPLEQFPRTSYAGPGWEMHLRQPNKKKITGQRFWKKVFVVVSCEGSAAVVQLYNAPGDKEPFQELPLQACYSVSEVGAQQFDQFGKIFTVKLQYVFYKERPGVRPGQVTKAERLTNKLSQFAAYAIQGDYQGVKEFGSDLRKLGLPVEHAPQVSQLFKLGSLNYEDVRQFSCCVEEALFRLPAHRDRALAYKMEEVQITCVDELYVEQDAEGSVLKQVARVRLFFLGFLSGMPDVEVGLNDLRRQGREVVGRHDIVPGATEEWIRVEDAQFHACVQPDQFEHNQILKFKPPDACYVEVIRFRVRPPKNRELPLQLRAVWCVTGNKVELRADVLVPGFASRRLGQVPCEDVAIRFPVPECWIYLFRVEKHFRYGSVKSAHRRTGKIKGIERLLGAVDTLQESLIEVTSGAAKYEHHHRALVWRMPRLPKEGQGAYTTHNLVCRLALTSYDQIPAELARWAHVDFTMPATTVSRATVRSVALHDHDGEPPEKFVRYLARHEYLVGIERTSGQSAPAYSLATATSPRAPTADPETAAPPTPQPPSSDSDSE